MENLIKYIKENYFLTGSRAFQKETNHVITRKDSDYDYLVTTCEFRKIMKTLKNNNIKLEYNNYYTSANIKFKYKNKEYNIIGKNDEEYLDWVFATNMIRYLVKTNDSRLIDILKNRTQKIKLFEFFRDSNIK